MGKIIHTKDGRTLMKGPDGRWMSTGKAAEKQAKKPITNETREGWNEILNSKDGDKIRIQDFSSLNHKPTGTETEYTLHNGRWSSANGHSFDNDITHKGFGSFEGITPKITKVESKAVKNMPLTPSEFLKRDADKYRENSMIAGKEGWGKGYLQEVKNFIKSEDKKAVKKPATQFERDQKLAEKGGKEYEDMMKRREEAVKAASDRAKTSNSFIRKAALQERDRLRKEYEDLAEYAGDEVKRKTPRDHELLRKQAKELGLDPSMSTEQLKKAINTINNAGPMTVSTAQRRDSLSNVSKSKSLSFEKRDGYGLNPSEYKLSNGDGISPKSLNPNEGNPTNIKKLKDIPGRTSRHTDEIIVKSNYGDKEYVVTREHYQDTKTGYHRAEVVDIRQHVVDKEKAPAKKESFKAKERTDYINNISKLRNNGDKKDEDWRVVRQTLDHAPTGTVMIEKGERGSERQYKKLADGSWEYITGSYKGEKTDSKTMSMGWAGHTGMSPSIEFTTEKKMAAAKAKAQKLPKFVENAKSPATVVTKTGNKMLLDLGNSDFTAVNVRTLEKQGWKRRGTSDLTWYKNI